MTRPTTCPALFLLLATVSLTAALPAQVDAWRADLAHLCAELPKRHKNPFTIVDEATWRKEAAALDARLGELKSDAAFEFELRKLIARVGDSHTTLSGKSLGGGAYLPIGVHWYEDGLRVAQIAREHRALLGWKLAGVGSASMDQVVKKLATVQVFDNEARIKQGVPRSIMSPRLLHLLGLTSEPDAATFRLERGSEVKTLELKAGTFGAFPARRRPKATMITARQGKKWFSTRFLANEGLLYVQYNRCATNGSWDVSKLTKQIAARMAAGEVKTFVFDVQYNGGGNSMIADMMFAQLSRHEPFKSRKNLFCVIGRQTFSSAILNAMRLKTKYGATLVGEPTGGSPNHFGEVRKFELPSKSYVVHYSTKLFLHGAPGAKTITPDHVAAASYADFLAGRDPVLDKVRSLVR